MAINTELVEFGTLGDIPVVWAPDGQAWWYIAPWPQKNLANPEWRRLSNSYANVRSCRLTEKAFKERFAGLPLMPLGAIPEGTGMRFLRDATGPIPNDWFENDPGPRTDLRAPFDAQSKELAAFVEKREGTKSQ